jgi:ankyrin repeat protein
MRASYNGNIQLIQLLLNLKADINCMTPKGETALNVAIKRNHIKIVEELIEAGADLGLVSKIGLRVIEYAILPGFYDICQLIYKKLTLEQKREIQDPDSYAQLAKKYAYRYVNYNVLL